MSTAHTIEILAIAWLLTSATVFGIAWELRGWLADRQATQAEAGQPVPYQVTRRDWVDFVPYGPPGFQGAADRAFEVPDPMVMAAAGYQLGQQSMTAAEAHREVAAIWAEIEANPERWQP